MSDVSTTTVLTPSKNLNITELQSAVSELNTHFKFINGFILTYFDKDAVLSKAYKDIILTEPPKRWMDGVQAWKEELERPSTPPRIPETAEEAVYQRIAGLIRANGNDLKLDVARFNEAVTFAHGRIDPISDLRYIDAILQSVQRDKELQEEWAAYPLFAAMAEHLITGVSQELVTKIREIDAKAADDIENQGSIPGEKKSSDSETTSHIVSGAISGTTKEDSTESTNTVSDAKERTVRQLSDLRDEGSRLIYSYTQPISPEDLENRLSALGIDSKTHPELLKDMMGIYTDHAKEMKWDTGKIVSTQPLAELLSNNSGQEAFIKKKIEAVALFASLSYELHQAGSPDAKLAADLIKDITARYGEIGTQISVQELQTLITQKKNEYQSIIKAFKGKNVLLSGPQSGEVLTAMLEIAQDAKNFEGMPAPDIPRMYFATPVQNAEIEKTFEVEHKKKVIATFHTVVGPTTSPQAQVVDSSDQEHVKKLVDKLWPNFYTTNPVSVRKLLSDHEKEIFAGRNLTPGEKDKLMRQLEKALTPDFIEAKQTYYKNRQIQQTQEVLITQEGYSDDSSIFDQFGYYPEDDSVLISNTDEPVFDDEGGLQISDDGFERQRASSPTNSPGFFGRMRGLLPGGKRKKDIQKAQAVVKTARWFANPGMLAGGAAVGGGAALIAGLATKAAPLIIGGATATGAGVGFLIAGPAGALIGGGVGLVSGALANSVVQAGVTGGLPTAPAGVSVGSSFASAGPGFASGVGNASGAIAQTATNAVMNATGTGITNASAAINALATASPAVPVAVLFPATLGVVAVVTIITSAVLIPGAFLVPGGPTQQCSADICIEKNPNPEFAEDPTPVTYTISITPVEPGKNIEITSVSDAMSVTYADDKDPKPQPKVVPASDIAGLVGILGEEKSVEYTVTFGPEYDDTRVTNTITVNYTVDGKEDTYQAQAAVTFGTPPATGCWPVSGTLTNIPFTGGPTHIDTDSYDIAAPMGTTIQAPFSGTLLSFNQGEADGDWWDAGNFVVLQSDIGYDFIFEHLSEVPPEGPVNAGQSIGKVGSTGNSTGPHLHYELRRRWNQLAAGPPSLLATIVPEDANGGAHEVGDEVSSTTCGEGTTTETVTREGCFVFDNTDQPWTPEEIEKVRKVIKDEIFNDPKVERLVCTNGSVPQDVRLTRTSKACTDPGAGDWSGYTSSTSSIEFCDNLFDGDFDRSRFGRSTILHEPAHLIQLRHPFRYNDALKTVDPDGLIFKNKASFYSDTYPYKYENQTDPELEDTEIEAKIPPENFGEAFGLCRGIQNRFSEGLGYRGKYSSTTAQSQALSKYATECSAMRSILNQMTE